MRTLENQGYYDIQPLKATSDGYTTQARRYGKEVTVNVSKRNGFITEPGNDD